MEDHFLNPEVELLKEIGGYVSNLKRVGDGLGVYMFDHELMEDWSLYLPQTWHSTYLINYLMHN